MSGKEAIIIGAGPAGLTMAHELLARTDITPIVLEAGDALGGISRTACYKGNRIDIGGHRFFSKSDRVMQWWLARLPLQRTQHAARLEYQGAGTLMPPDAAAADPQSDDRVMLVRQRKSRIYFLRKFFDYPLQLTADTVRKLGLARMARIGLSYAKATAFPYRPARNLEQFFINRFGRELYLTFFKSYTEKVWGERCDEISAEWGAQRVKGLSITRALTHFLRRLVHRSPDAIAQRHTETSLIEQFLYPKYGPGQMWELVAEEVRQRGGRMVMHQRVERILVEEERVAAVEAVDPRSGETTIYRGDYFVSTMPMRDLVQAMAAPVPPGVREVADGLIYRDFITVGLLLTRLAVRAEGAQQHKLIDDNWIYIQEPDVRVGRLQVFNNWSPYLVADPSKVWIGLEYFCYESDDLWRRSDAEMIALAKSELAKIEIIDPADVIDATVLRVPKTYPAYFGTYARLGEVRAFLEQYDNLFLIGRNGMHRYNNQDHSMLTAMVAVDNLVAGRSDKSNIWAVNTDQEYHETRTANEAAENVASGPHFGPRGAGRRGRPAVPTAGVRHG